MEYAAAVFRLGYEELESAVQSARRAAGQVVEPLTALVAAHAPESFDETTFTDAVTLNLRRGRAIVAVVGDRIREDIGPLAGLLQSHAGLRFVFVLVELGIHETPISGIRLVYPSVLAQTTLIERGVIQIDDRATGGGATISVSPPAVSGPRTSKARGMNLGEDEFYELLDQREPGIAAVLKAPRRLSPGRPAACACRPSLARAVGGERRGRALERLLADHHGRERAEPDQIGDPAGLDQKQGCTEQE
jgi:hypothetical protein